MRSIHLTHTQARLVSDCSSLRETYSLNHQHWYSWIPHSRCLWGTWSGSVDTWTEILSGNNKTELDFPQEKFEFFIQKPKKLHSRDYIFINFQRHSMHKKREKILNYNGQQKNVPSLHMVFTTLSWSGSLEEGPSRLGGTMGGVLWESEGAIGDVPGGVLEIF